MYPFSSESIFSLLVKSKQHSSHDMITSWIFCLHCFLRLVLNHNFLDAIFQYGLVAYAMLLSNKMFHFLIFTWISFFFSRSQVALLCVPESTIQWSNFAAIVLKFPQFEQKKVFLQDYVTCPTWSPNHPGLCPPQITSQQEGLLAGAPCAARPAKFTFTFQFWVDLEIHFYFLSL